MIDYRPMLHEDVVSITNLEEDILPTGEPRLAGALLLFAEPAMATWHRARLTGNGPVLGAGKLLSGQTRRRLASILDRRDRRELTWVDNDVLAEGPESIVFRCEPCVHAMHFRAAGNKLISLRVPWPALIVKATASTLDVAALKRRGRPTPRTHLFHAPLANVGPSGGVCIGSARMPSYSGAASIPAWRSVIYDSAFSHVNWPGTLLVADQVDTAEHIQFWQRLHESRATAFPTDALRPMHRSLGSWLGLT